MAVQGPRAFRAHVAPENQCFLPVLTPARGWGWTSEGRNARCPLHMAVRRCVPAGGRHSHSELVTVRAINCSKNRLAHLFEYKKVRFRSQNRPPNRVTFHCEETAVPWLHRHTWHVGRFVVDVPPPLEGRRLCPRGPSVVPSALKTAPRGEWAMLAHLAAETPEPAAPEAGLQDPGGCQAACPACSGVTEASVTVCLFVNGGGCLRGTCSSAGIAT